MSEKAACRMCGCTDDRACPGGCWWIEPDLCSACVETDAEEDDYCDCGAAHTLEEIDGGVCDACGGFIGE